MSLRGGVVEKPLVLLTEPYVEVTDAKPLERLKEYAEVRVARGTSEEVLAQEVKDATALIVRLAKITRRIIESGKALRVISRTGVGVDNIDVDAATERGIFVCNIPTGVNSDAVAEHTFCLILALAKNLIEADSRFRAEGWAIRDQLWVRNIDLYGKVIGIIGLGAIGSRVARIARAFGMTVLAYDPYISAEKAESVGARLVDLDTLLRESDFVTIHCPLTKETENLIDEKRIRLMKRTAFLINCARGPIVKESALVEALEKNMIAGAALDVFAVEPVRPDNPLLKLKNVIVTPHIAGMTYDVRVKSMEILVNDVIRVLKGEIPENLVNREVLKRLGQK
jgi:D-3-phosphoglycerate dehydrogenase